MNMKFKNGDSVIVNQGVKEPDFEEFELSGWKGRIIEIDDKSNKDNILITIEWDSITLKLIPSDYIEKSEIEGHDWSRMILYESDLEMSAPADKKGDVKKIKDELLNKYHWASFGEEGLRISKILQDINPKNEMKCLKKWVEHLDKELTFPVKAIVSESEDNWLIKSRDKVVINSLPHIVDMYGIIASIRLNGKKYEFPLCDLEVIDKTMPDYQLIKDYCIWFSNR
jgi:hypothetical protein